MNHDYGIVMGSSHCEMLLRNNEAEWKRPGLYGAYNYATNRATMIRYWADRVRTNGGFENSYTIGLRGVHDTAMEGAKTLEERTALTKLAIADQRELLAKYVNPDLSRVCQMFCAYKEVLAIYQNGLNLAPDVTRSGRMTTTASSAICPRRRNKNVRADRAFITTFRITATRKVICGLVPFHPRSSPARWAKPMPTARIASGFSTSATSSPPSRNSPSRWKWRGTRSAGRRPTRTHLSTTGRRARSGRNTPMTSARSCRNIIASPPRPSRSRRG